MENTFDPIKPLFDKLKTYANTSYELYKLKTVSKTAKVVSTLVTRITIIIILFMFLIFASLGLALWLGDMFGENHLGFLCIAGFYSLLGILFYFSKHFIKRKISNAVISEILNHKDDDNK